MSSVSGWLQSVTARKPLASSSSFCAPPLLCTRPPDTRLPACVLAAPAAPFARQSNMLKAPSANGSNANDDALSDIVMDESAAPSTVPSRQVSLAAIPRDASFAGGPGETKWPRPTTTGAAIVSQTFKHR